MVVVRESVAHVGQDRLGARPRLGACVLDLADEVPHPVLERLRPGARLRDAFAHRPFARRHRGPRQDGDHVPGGRGRDLREHGPRGGGGLQPVGRVAVDAESGQACLQQAGVAAHRRGGGAGDRLDARAGRRGVGGGRQRRDRHAEQAPHAGQARVPLALVGRGLLGEHPGVVEGRDRAVAGAAVERKRHAALRRPGEDHEVLRRPREAHALRLVDPAAQLLHGEGPRIEGLLPAEVVLPVVADDEVRAVVRHLAEEQGVGDLPEERAVVALDGGAAVAGLARLDHLLEHRVELAVRERRSQFRGGGKLPGQRLPEEVVEGGGERRAGRGAEREAGGQRLEPVGDVDVVRLVDDAGAAPAAQAVGDVHGRHDLAAERVALVLQDPVGRLAGRRGEVRGVAVEAIAAEYVLEHGEPPQVVERALREEGGHPADRLGGALQAPAFVELREIVARGEVLLVEGEVDHHLPVVGGVAQLLGAHVADVAEHDRRPALDAAPPERVLLLEQRGILDAEGLLEDDLPDDLHPVAVAVFAGGALEDAVGVDVGEHDADRGVARIAADADLTHLGGPAAHLVVHRLHLAADDRRENRAVVQCGEAFGGHPLEGLHLRHEGRQEERLHESFVGDERPAGRILFRQPPDLVPGLPVLRLEHGEELRDEELLGVLEVGDDVGVGDRVAVDEDVEQVADRHEVGHLERVAVIDEELHEHLERGPFALEDARHGDERLDQGRRKGIHLPEHLPVAVGGEERVHHAGAHARGAVESGVDLGPGGGALRPQHALLGDHGQIAVGELDRAEAAAVPADEVDVVEPGGAGHGGADEVAEVALPGDEAGDRRRAVGVLRFDELGELARLALEERLVAGVRGEPQHELVEEQHQAVVPEGLGVAGEHRQPVVEIDVFREDVLRRPVVLAESVDERRMFGPEG